MGVMPQKLKTRHLSKIAVAGSGPAGLSCAWFLANFGYPVTVFESASEPGGMLPYGARFLNREGWDFMLRYSPERGSKVDPHYNIRGMPLVAIIALVSLFTIAIHLIIPVNTPIVGVILPPVVAVAAVLSINPAVLALLIGFSVSAAVLLPLDAASLVTFQAGYYRMTDMFKPGLIISAGWAIITVALMYLIATPLGFM